MKGHDGCTSCRSQWSLVGHLLWPPVGGILQLQVIQSATDWPQYQSVELFLVIDLQLEASPKGVCHGREC